MKFLIIILAFIGLLSLGNIASDVRERTMSEQPEGYSDVAVIIDHEANTCSTNSDFFDFTATLNYVEPTDEFVGQWSYDDKVMSLNKEKGLDVGTVSHEVAHMVEGVMEEYNVHDSHYGPYLQGIFTYCMWGLVEQDLIEAGNLKVYRFAQ